MRVLQIAMAYGAWSIGKFKKRLVVEGGQWSDVINHKLHVNDLY
jgi:hypothetical protein